MDVSVRNVSISNASADVFEQSATKGVQFIVLSVDKVAKTGHPSKI